MTFKKQKTTTTKYSNTKVKTRNLLTNVSYRRYKLEDVEKTNFVIDVFSFLTQNLNPTGLDRKLETLLERDVKKVWDTCVPHKFTKFNFHFNNWKHHKNNIVLPTPTKNRVSEQPTKSKVPENEITITQLQQQQKQQNEQQKEEILEAGKRPESYEKSCSSF